VAATAAVGPREAEFPAATAAAAAAGAGCDAAPTGLVVVGVQRFVHDLKAAAEAELADLRGRVVATEHGVDGLGDVGVDGDALPALDFDDDVEGRGGLPFEDGLLGTATPGLFVAKGDGLDAADKVGEGGIEHEVLELGAVGGTDELHAPLGDGARGGGLELGPDLVDDDDFGHVVLDGLDHDRVLIRGGRNLHAAGAADGGMGDIAVAADFVRGVDDDDALVGVIGEDAGDFAQHGGLANAGAAEQEHTLAAENEVFDDADGAVDGAPNAAGDTDDLAPPVADAGDAVEGALDAGAVIEAEFADVVDDVEEVVLGDFLVGEDDFAAGVASLGQAAEVHDDFEEAGAALGLAQDVADAGGQGIKKKIEVVGDDLLGVFGFGTGKFKLCHGHYCGRASDSAGTAATSLRVLRSAMRRAQMRRTPRGV